VIRIAEMLGAVGWDGFSNTPALVCGLDGARVGEVAVLEDSAALSWVACVRP
jgi:hypothetical protein